MKKTIPSKAKSKSPTKSVSLKSSPRKTTVSRSKVRAAVKASVVGDKPKLVNTNTKTTTVPKPNSVMINGDVFTSGDDFKCKIYDKVVEGKIYVDDGDRIFLCQNNQSGLISPEKLGFKYSWTWNGKDGGDSVTHFVLNPGSKITSYLGYDIRKVNDVIFFGCGSVQINMKDIKTFLDITTLAGKRGVNDLNEVKKVLIQLSYL